MVFLELVIVIAILVFFTQVLLPFMFPRFFKSYFWAFKTKELKDEDGEPQENNDEATLADKVDNVTHKKEELDKEIDDVNDETNRELEKAKQLDDRAKGLKN